MPVLDRKELEESPLSDLHAIASELGIEGYRRLRREELIDALAGAEGKADDGKKDEEDPPPPPPRRRRTRRTRTSAKTEEPKDEAPPEEPEAEPADAAAEEDEHE